VGARFTVNLSRYFAFDSDFAISPRDEEAATNVDGGRVAQGQFGIKLGQRLKKFGVFGKARPGFISFSQAITNVPALFDRGRRTFFSFDLGGVVELYPKDRIILRADLGNTFIRYPTIQTPFGAISPTTTNNLQFSTSVQFRF
jgi:hypothetical protein